LPAVNGNIHPVLNIVKSILTVAGAAFFAALSFLSSIFASPFLQHYHFGIQNESVFSAKMAAICVELP
jgi:hypothetical protein